MKKVKLNLIITLLLFAAANIFPLKSDAQVAVNFQVFYDGLAPYGNWVTYPGYGYVWVPNAGPDFRPYVNSGHWAYSDDGWVWVSDYDWGWAPFHYGSWLDDPAYGWMWVPGYDWAPAWVTWGSYNGYYGWAPCAPGFSVSVGYYPPIDRWCFVEPRYMAAGGFGNHYYVASGGRISIGGGIVITNERRISSISNTANYGGHGYYAGPRRQEFERVAHTTVTPVSIRESNSPGRARIAGNTVNIYRPRINPGTKVYSKPASAVPVDRVNARQSAPATGNNRPGSRTVENRPATNNNVHPSNQQSHPAVQPQRGNNSAPQQHAMTPQERQVQHAPSAPAQHQQMAPAQRQQQQQHSQAPQQQQHSQAPQQQRQAPAMQHQQQSRPAMAPQQREQAPRQEPQREEGGRPHGFR